jgi:hypothetical protein
MSPEFSVAVCVGHSYCWVRVDLVHWLCFLSASKKHRDCIFLLLPQMQQKSKIDAQLLTKITMHLATLLSGADEVSGVIMAVSTDTFKDAQKIIIAASHAIIQGKFLPVFTNDVQNNIGFTLLKTIWLWQCFAVRTMSDNQLT